MQARISQGARAARAVRAPHLARTHILCVLKGFAEQCIGRASLPTGWRRRGDSSTKLTRTHAPHRGVHAWIACSKVRAALAREVWKLVHKLRKARGRPDFGARSYGVKPSMLGGAAAVGAFLFAFGGDTVRLPSRIEVLRSRRRADRAGRANGSRTRGSAAKSVSAALQRVGHVVGQIGHREFVSWHDFQ